MEVVIHEQRVADLACTLALSSSDKPDLVVRGFLDERALRLDRFNGLLTMVPRPSPGEVPAFPAVPDVVDATSIYKDGLEVFKDKGCARCHTADGTRLVGGSMKGLLGSTITHTDESQAVVDAAYVREALFDPQKRVTKGFLPVMPSYAGKMKAADVDLLLIWMRSLDLTEGAAPGQP
jgi:cytochrome c oxidase subunit 2